MANQLMAKLRMADGEFGVLPTTIIDQGPI